jgi:23S rRNA pseudouridine2605 synthase
MATNNFKPGAGKFASGNKFKGRASSGGDSSNSRSSRDAHADRQPRSFKNEGPDREHNGERAGRTGKFSGEGRKVFNRSERFTRSGEEGAPRPSGERSRSFEKSGFKSKPKFSKPAPYKGGQRADEGNAGAEGFDKASRRDDQRGADRPRYGERKQAEGSYAARGERKPYTARPKSFGPDKSREATGYRSRETGEKSFGGDKNREGGSYRSRETGGENENRPVKPYRMPGTDRPAGERKAYGHAKPAAGHGRDDKRSFRSKAEEPAEAPNYDLKRFQGREPRHVEKKADSGLIRLNRYIANAGICSRREADNLIAAGEIKVNGEVVTEMGYTVRPEDTVTYGKKRLNREKMVYVLLNKPKDFITTTEDPEGRKTVMDLVSKASKERIFPVGRLDRNTTGLLLFTNDGELAHKLTHPSNNISKIYQVELDKPITREHFEQIVNGLELEDGKAEVDDLALIGNSNTFLGIQIHIGKNRIVRRIFEHLGYEVVSLDRVQYAGLTKKDLPRGQWRFLNEKEVIRLKYFL